MKAQVASSLATVALAVFAGTLVGQDRPQTREGFFIGVGIGAASLGCSDCDQRKPGIALQFTVGGAVDDRLLIGFDLAAWGHSEGAVNQMYGNGTAALLFYPMPASGFFLKGGVGFAVFTTEQSVPLGTLTSEEQGAGITVGVGYDIRVGTNFSVTPFANVLFGSLEGGNNVNAVHLGIGATWH